MHLFLSPHLDDAVLSCGGTIYQLTRQGETVTVLTTMAGEPPRDMPETPITADLAQRWGVDVQARRREDRQALACLGADFIHISIEDCVYRTVRKNGQNVALYPTEESLWGDVHPDDYAPGILRSTRVPAATTLYAPLGARHHVDHRIVRDWGLWLKRQNSTYRLILYEEYPYEVDAIMELEQALAYFSPREMQLEIRPMREADVTAKIRAIACYQSQISTFWTGVAEMEARTRRSMIEAGGGAPAERFWQPVE